MTRQELYNMFVRSKRPIDCFGDVKDEAELKKVYRNFARQIHPDTASPRDKYISEQGMSILNDLYNLGLTELEQGIYSIKNILDLYQHQDPLFEIKVKGNPYKFYEQVATGEVADIYRGIADNNLVVLKIAMDEGDNALLKQEFDTLNSYTHQSMPIVRDFVKINGRAGIVMDNIEGMPLVEIMKKYPKGLDPKIVMWVMERLFSIVGYLHSNMIVHGNIIPENIIINGINHNTSLLGFSFHIPKANEKDKHYQIRSEEFSAPEVNKTSQVLPKSDIYSLGKLAIYMLGGSTFTNGMPVSVNQQVREFIRTLVVEDVDKRPIDAWKLWDDWRDIRVKAYGKPKYVPVEF